MHTSSNRSGLSLPKSLIKWILGCAIVLASPITPAVPMTFFGTDTANNVTTNSDQAFANWSASVGGAFVLDNLDGIETDATRTSNLGNSFSSVDDALGTLNITTNVLEGISLRVFRSGNLATFIWDLAEEADAFGFFGRANNGGTITIEFNDGTSRTETVTAANSVNDNLFWGISGLDAAVSSVSISTSDPVNISSFWDRFAYTPTVEVPEPTTLGLVGLALVGLGLRKKAR